LKLSKTSWIALTVGICVIAFASLGVARFQQAQEQDQLREELSLAEQRLSKFQFEELSSQQGELEKRLKLTTLQLGNTKAILSEPTKSIAATDTLFDIAEDCDVEVTEISSSDPTSGALEEVTCSVLPVTVRVEGDVISITSFIVKLNSDFTTGVVQAANISVSEDTTEEMSSANIQLLIYTYEGD
jgi:hypothetical protein